MDEKKIVVFNINNLEYGLSSDHVHSIEKMQYITRVPFAQNYIKGVFNIRGVVIPIINLSTILETNPSVENEEQKILIVHYKDIQVGLLIDEATDLLDADENLLEPMDDKFDLSHLFSSVLKIEDRLISILDIERVLYPDRKED